MYTQNFINEMKTLLLQKKQEFENELKNLSEHTELGSDVDSQIQEAETDELNKDLILTLKKDLEKIDTALDKIKNGTYGIDSNGNKIAEDRLRILPWADKAI